MKANFVPIPNLSDDTINRLQGNIGKAFTNLDTPAALSVRTVNANYLVSVDDDVVLCDPSLAGFTVSLPALGVLTKVVSIRIKPGLNTANLVTVKAPTPVTIDSAASANLSTIPMRLVSNAQGYWSA